MATIVTGFSPKGYIEYGANFLTTFEQHWHYTHRLLCFTEESVPVPRGGARSLWTCKGMREFIERHSGSPVANGREPIPGKWGQKHIDRGYYYKFDTVKFSRQCFIPEGAAEELADGEIMVWMDADVVTFRKVPAEFVESLLGKHDLCYLGRRGMHTELGFWAVRLGHKTRMFLEHFANMFRGDEVFKLPEWHSAYVFDHVRGLHERAGEIRSLNLTPAGQGHVWFQSPLGRYTDHLKGDRRKAAGRSLERVG